jgi:hypothetical protein
MPKPKIAQKAPAAPAAPEGNNVAVMPETLEMSLRHMNEQVVFVNSTKEIAELHPVRNEIRLNYMSPYDFKNASYSDRSVIDHGKRYFIAAEWMRWAHRRKVNKTVYEPGQPRITSEGNLNTWFPSLCAPKQGDLTLWNRYLDHIFSSEPEYRDWFIHWLAYPIQNPGAKLHTAVVFWSTQTGTGKSTLAYIMKEIYGQHNCSRLQEGDLSAHFNGWAVNKQFIEVDEMSGRGSEARAELLKAFITRQTIPVDLKYQNRYEIRDTLNYFFTTNHIESLHLDEDDRRFFVHNVGSVKLSADFFQTEFGPWLKSDGFAAIAWHLLHEVDLSKPILGGDPYSDTSAVFRPGSAAPMTASRQMVIESSMDDIEGWLTDLKSDPELAIGRNQSLFTAKELYGLFKENRPDAKVTPALFGRRAKRILTLCGRGNPIRLPGTYDRVLSINPDHAMLLPSELKEIYDTESISNL